MGCCCCPRRDVGGSANIWLFEKATGDVVWKRSPGGATIVRLGEEFVINGAREGVNGVWKFKRDDVWMEEVGWTPYSSGSSIQPGWGQAFTSVPDPWTDSGVTYTPQYWYTGGTDPDRQHVVINATSGGNTSCFSSDWTGGSLISGTQPHQAHNPPQTIGDVLVSVGWRRVTTTPIQWAYAKGNLQTGLSNIELHPAGIMAWNPGSGNPNERYGLPFHTDGTLSYTLANSTLDENGDLFESEGLGLVVRCWDLTNGDEISAWSKDEYTYQQRGYVAGGNFYFQGTIEGSEGMKCLTLADGEIVGDVTTKIAANGSVFGVQQAYGRSGGDFMVTDQDALNNRQIRRFAPDCSVRWTRSGNRFGGNHWPIGDLTLMSSGILLDADGDTLWARPESNAFITAALDEGDYILCGGTLTS